MLLGLGIDLVDIGRIGEIRRKHGERFHERVFTPQETAYCLGRADTDRHFAARWAAKEAAAKALGTGIGQSVGFHGIEVVRDGDGPPRLALHAGAAERAKALGATKFHLSLTHTDQVAAAVVVLEA
jgi:holo-[acyl-carrier protein] synthase